MRERRAMISAWQSLSARPRSLMYSPLMHLVPVETQMTCASFTSVPVGTVLKKIKKNIEKYVGRLSCNQIKSYVCVCV